MRYTAEQLRQAAEREERIYGQQTIPAMLRQGADAMERQPARMPPGSGFVIGALAGVLMWVFIIILAVALT